MRAVILASFTLLLLNICCLGQSDWTTVRDLKPGTRVVVVERSGAEAKGRIAGIDETTISLDKGRSISRDSIARVYLTKRRIDAKAGIDRCGSGERGSELP